MVSYFGISKSVFKKFKSSQILSVVNSTRNFSSVSSFIHCKSCTRQTDCARHKVCCTLDDDDEIGLGFDMNGNLGVGIESGIPLRNVTNFVNFNNNHDSKDAHHTPPCSSPSSAPSTTNSWFSSVVSFSSNDDGGSDD